MQMSSPPVDNMESPSIPDDETVNIALSQSDMPSSIDSSLISNDPFEPFHHSSSPQTDQMSVCSPLSSIPSDFDEFESLRSIPGLPNSPTLKGAKSEPDDLVSNVTLEENSARRSSVITPDDWSHERPTRSRNPPKRFGQSHSQEVSNNGKKGYVSHSSPSTKSSQSSTKTKPSKKRPLDASVEDDQAFAAKKRAKPRKDPSMNTRLSHIQVKDARETNVIDTTPDVAMESLEPTDRDDQVAQIGNEQETKIGDAIPDIAMGSLDSSNESSATEALQSISPSKPLQSGQFLKPLQSSSSESLVQRTRLRLLHGNQNLGVSRVVSPLHSPQRSKSLEPLQMKLSSEPLQRSTSVPLKSVYLPTFLRAGHSPKLSQSTNSPEPPESKHYLVKLRLGTEKTSKLEMTWHERASLIESLALKTDIANKPGPARQPQVWAEDRQSLCETLPYYRAFQGACYMKGGLIRAMMFDENGHNRDFMDAEVIISRAGGGMARDKAGNLVQIKGQAENAQSRSMQNNMLQEIPIVIIAGDKNSACPSRLPHRYCVLGFFKVTDIVPRKGQKKNQNIIQYRFEKLNPDEKGWWEPLGVEPAVRLGKLLPPATGMCGVCKASHEQVYLKWICLTPSCTAYWKLLDGAEPDPADVANFNPAWLKKRSRWESELDPFDLRPAPIMSQHQLENTYPHSSTKGLCCPKCGKCNSRYKFTGWQCRDHEEGHDCDFVHSPTPAIASSHALRNPARAVGLGSPISYDMASDFIQSSHAYKLSHRINSFRIPGLENDVIFHMIANQRVLEEPHGPDEMLQAMQQQDIGLERRFMVSGKLFGRMSAFSVNHGYPYKFVATVASRTFGDAPWVINETRTQLNFFSKLVLEKRFPERAYNELLTFAYLEGQMIKYHDDGETGLGSTVATYSLGAPAEMSFRMKGKYWTGVVMRTGDGGEDNDSEDDDDEGEEKDNEDEDAGAKKKSKKVKDKRKYPYFLAEPPLENTEHYEARKAALESLQGLSRDDFEKRCRELPQELGLRYKKGSPPLISLHLAHGDKIIMHGEAIQKYFEHQVEPVPGHGVRFANTCRQILPHHLPERMRPTEDVPADTGDYDGSGLVG